MYTMATSAPPPAESVVDLAPVPAPGGLEKAKHESQEVEDGRDQEEEERAPCQVESEPIVSTRALLCLHVHVVISLNVELHLASK